MVKTSKNRALIRTILYIVGVSLLFLGLISLPFVGDYVYIPVILIVAGIVVFATIPLSKK